MYNKSQFVFSETFNNKDGKTSGSGFIGVILGITAVAMVAAGTFGFFFEIPNTLEYLGVALKIIAASTILLGVRKVGGQISEARNGKEPTTPAAPPLFQGNPSENEKG